MRPLARPRRGVTLVELMIAVAFISAVGVATALVFTSTMKALTLSKARGASARIAQDKIESLRALSYPLLLVTSQEDLDTSPGVDLTNYPPETFIMSDKAFERSVIVKKVYKDSGGAIVALAPSAADTGLKQVTVRVEFPLGTGTETRTYTALISDSDLVALDGMLYGVVTDTSGVALAGAKVFINENQNWTALTSATGYYQIETDTKTYTATAMLSGYFDLATDSITIGVGGQQRDFSLTRRDRGKVTGQAMLQPPDHLLISQVVFSTVTQCDGGLRDVEYVELFNPTTYAINIGVSGGPKTWYLNFTDEDGGSDNKADAGFAFVHIATYVPPASYYLYANATYFFAAGSWVNPDAYYGTLYANYLNAGEAGTLALQDSGGTTTADRLGWNDADDSAPSHEGTPVPNPPSGDGPGVGNQLVRRSSWNFASSSYGRALDTDSNIDDFLSASTTTGLNHRPFGSSDPAQPISMPASSATIVVTDGFSSAVYASATGYFLVTDVATGTWAMAAYWNSFSTITAAEVSVLAGQTTQRALALEGGSGGIGGISGVVRRSDTLTPLSGITVTAGTKSSVTDLAGTYILSVATGSHTLIANDGYADLNYSVISASLTVSNSSVAVGMNFSLTPAGRASGKVTTNGVDPYPGILVHGLLGGVEYATALSDSGGNFTLYGIPVGGAVVEPVLDPQSQTSSPGSSNATVTQGGDAADNDFAVTSSLGIIRGTVKSATTAITTGVLVTASTTSLASLPTVDNAYRTGSTVLYSVVSDTEGNYSLSVVKNSTYAIYGIYTTLSGTTGTNSVQVSSTNVLVSTISTVNLVW
ncbi:MAG: carboxypeptidase regulatory-like domain-containing protein [Elusimicrobia bacterium]|nr:carboxypeptidase regulatory-like domain-containing protein [Elusimicrobiota bacterium]